MEHNNHNQLVLNDFLEIVGTYSASGDERLVADLLKRKLEEVGCINIYEDDAGSQFGGNTGNIHAVFPGAFPGSVLFTAHMDRGEIMLINGARPTIRPVINEKENRIETDGTTLLGADDAAGLAAILDGIRRLKVSGQPHCDMEVLFTVSEEAGIQGSRYADYDRIKAKIAFAMDSRGPFGKISSSAPSGAGMSVEIFGKGAHYASAPGVGIDAAHAAAKILLNIQKGQIDEKTASNFPVLLAGEDATYGICDYAIIKGQVQSMEHRKMLNYLDYFEQFCRESVQDTGIRLKFGREVFYEAFSVPDDAGSVRLASKVLTDMGKEPFTAEIMACQDSQNFVRHGIDSVGLSMGYYLNHSKNEYMDLDQLYENGNFIRDVMLEYSRHPEAYDC